MTLQNCGTGLQSTRLLVLFLILSALVPHACAETAVYWVQASKSFANSGRWDESLDAAEKALAIDSGNKNAWLNKANALKNLNRDQEALDACEKALSIDPDFINAWVMKSAILNSLGRHKDGLDAAQKAISLDPNSYTGWDLKAVSLSKLNRYQDAIDAADMSISINPSYAKSWGNKGYALQNLGKYKEALAAYDKALSLDPNLEMAADNRQIIISYLLPNSTNPKKTAVPVTISGSTAQPMAGTASQDVTPPVPNLRALFLPLVIVMLVIALGGGIYAYRNHKQKTPVTLPHPPVSASTVPGSPPAKSHHDVFISYAQVNKPVADAACAKIESRNIRCWIAPRDVPPGKNFPEAIVRGIEGSRIMVLIFSSHSNKSQHVLRELTTAVKNELIIIPFRIENVEPTKSMEYLIGIPHWLDAITPPLEKHLDTLVKTIEIYIASDIKKTDEDN
ncbi:MAG: tetratricopeptide repeat protein [Methanoregula sp.]|nr:MAG: tetratricopeptide repeat protein [Methanoregula sp.]